MLTPVPKISFAARNPETHRQDRNHSVCILGTSRDNRVSKTYCEIAGEVAQKLAEHDFDVWTGGCTGVAVAANKAANEVNPQTSWAIGVKKLMKKANKKIQESEVFKMFCMKESGPERTQEFINNCQHSVLLGGGAGTGQELWTQLEAKGYKWSEDNLAIDDITLVNDRGFFNPHLAALDNIGSPLFNLGNNPDKSRSMRELINKVVNIDATNMTSSSIKRTSEEIVRHIIEDANSRAASDDQITYKPTSTPIKAA